MRRRHPLTLALALMLAGAAPTACGGDGGSGTPGDGETIDNPDADAGLDVDFQPTPDAGDEGEVGEPAPVETPLGATCAGDEDCGTDGVCLDDGLYPGGYCADTGCAETSDCAAGGVCVERGGESFCAARCVGETECRNGYACISQPGSPLSACLPAGNPGGAVDGDPCQSDADCRGGTCIDSDGWEDGYCTTTFCQTFEDCATDGQDNRCLIQRGATNFCVRICTGDTECRNGYVCQGIGGGVGYCAPSPFQPPDITPGDYPFEISCQPVPSDGLVEITYDIAEDTMGYMVTPYASDGYWLNPIRVDLPVDGRVDFGGENDFQLTGAQLFGWTNPTIIPATAQLADQLQAGEHTYVLETDSEEICHYVLQESTPGTTLDLNVYLVDVANLDAETAPDDPDISALLESVDTIYGAAGIELGDVRFYDITGDDADRFSVIRSEADVAELVALSQRPGDTLDEVLSANVFFVRAISLGGAIGIASGLPGPAALHGTGGSGVVFTSQFLGQSFQDGGETVDGNAYTAVVFAHEVGHFLGLFHTSEQFGMGYDPLPDTPRCGRQDFPDGCEDLTNLMFPFAGLDHTVLTTDQGFVLQVNPLTKE